MGEVKYLNLLALILSFLCAYYLDSKWAEGETYPFPCQKIYGKEILYSKFFSEILVPLLRRYEDLGKELAVQENKEARTAGTDSDEKRTENICPGRHKIPGATL